MKNDWSTHTLSADSPILSRIGGTPGTYEIMWDKVSGILKIKYPVSGKIWSIQLSSSGDVSLLMSLGSKTRNDITQGESKLLKQLSDARYSNWVQWKQSGYEIRTKTDSTGFVKDILIRKIGTNNDHIHLYTDSVTGKNGSHLRVYIDGVEQRPRLIDKNLSVDDLISQFMP